MEGAAAAEIPPTPLAQPNMENIIESRTNWTDYRGLVTFDLRNGTLEDVVSLLIKPTIPQRFHWVPIHNLNPRDATLALDGFVKSHIHHLTQIGGAEASQALIRKLGIVLGTMRAIATTYFSLTSADFIPGELALPYLSALKNANGEIVYTMMPGIESATIFTDAFEFSTEEQAAISALVRCGLGVIPMQGYSLIMTGHHYLSDVNSQSRKVYDVVERAYWRGTAVGQWFTSDINDIQDAAWHKATHPVQMSIKEAVAMDRTIPDKLKAAQAGACASRLPASESELRAANSYLTVLRSVATLLAILGGSIDFRVLEEAAAAVNHFPSNGAPAEPVDFRSVPESVTDRKKAIEHLSEVLKRAANTAAYCYGFYCSMVEANQTLNNQNEGLSLKASNSLSKVKTQCYPAFLSGQQFYVDYTSLRNKQREEGNINVPNLVIT